MYVVYAFDLVAVIFFSFFIQHSIERKPKVKKEIEENIVRFDAWNWFEECTYLKA